MEALPPSRHYAFLGSTTNDGKRYSAFKFQRRNAAVLYSRITNQPIAYVLVEAVDDKYKSVMCNALAMQKEALADTTAAYQVLFKNDEIEFQFVVGNLLSLPIFGAANKRRLGIEILKVAPGAVETRINKINCIRPHESVEIKTDTSHEEQVMILHYAKDERGGLIDLKDSKPAEILKKKDSPPEASAAKQGAYFKVQVKGEQCERTGYGAKDAMFELGDVEWRLTEYFVIVDDYTTDDWLRPLTGVHGVYLSCSNNLEGMNPPGDDDDGMFDFSGSKHKKKAKAGSSPPEAHQKQAAHPLPVYDEPEEEEEGDCDGDFNLFGTPVHRPVEEKMAEATPDAFDLGGSLFDDDKRVTAVVEQSKLADVKYGRNEMVSSAKVNCIVGKCVAECVFGLSVQPRLEFKADHPRPTRTVAEVIAVYYLSSNDEFQKRAQKYISDSCCICLEEMPKIDTTFYSCAHTCTHAKCSQDLDTCPFCRADIIARLPFEAQKK